MERAKVKMEEIIKDKRKRKTHRGPRIGCAVIKLDKVTTERLGKLKEAYRSNSLSHAARLAIEDAFLLKTSVGTNE